MDSPRTRGEGATSSGVEEAWSVTMVLSARAPWPRPGRGPGAPTAVGPALRRLLGRTDITPGSACGPADVGRTSLPRRYHSCTGPAGPGRTASPSTWGTAATTSPADPGRTSPSSSGPGRRGLGRAGPGGPAPRLRGGPSEPCSRCRRGQPGVEGLPHRRWTTRATGRTGSRPRVCRCSHGLVVRDTSCTVSPSLPGRLETDDRGGQEP